MEVVYFPLIYYVKCKSSQFIAGEGCKVACMLPSFSFLSLLGIYEWINTSSASFNENNAAQLCPYLETAWFLYFLSRPLVPN